MFRFRPAVGQGFFDWIKPTEAEEGARREEMWEKMFGTPTPKEEIPRLIHERGGRPPGRFGGERAPWRGGGDGRPRWDGNGGPPWGEPSRAGRRGMFSETEASLYGYGNPGNEGFSWDLAAVVAAVGLVTVLELSGVTNIFGTRK